MCCLDTRTVVLLLVMRIEDVQGTGFMHRVVHSRHSCTSQYARGWTLSEHLVDLVCNILLRATWYKAVASVNDVALSEH